MSKKYTIDEILGNFRAQKPKKTVFGNYRIEENSLIYRAQTSEKWSLSWHDADSFKEFKKATGEKLREVDGKLLDRDGKIVLLESLTPNSRTGHLTIQYSEENYIAQKVPLENGETIFLGNISTLDLIGRTVSYGNESRNTSETDIQRAMKLLGFNMLKLSDFRDSDFSTFECLELGPEKSTLIESESGNYWSKQRHETLVKYRAMLFRIDGAVYLSDVDRRESIYKKLRYFVTEVSKNSKTIRDAYESLKPKAVRDAEAKGLDVKRIGNIFAIPCDAPKIPELTLEERFTVLAEASGYSLTESDIKHICGESYSKTRRDADAILEKVPRKRDIPGRGYTFALSIRLDGVLYAKDSISSTNRAELGLKQWHIIVDAKNGLKKLESESL